jgi:hypothetical protein
MVKTLSSEFTLIAFKFWLPTSLYQTLLDTETKGKTRSVEKYFIVEEITKHYVHQFAELQSDNNNTSQICYEYFMR